MAELDDALRLGVRVDKVDPKGTESEILNLRGELRRLKLEISRLETERNSAEEGERNQRVRAERAERISDGLNAQLQTAQEQISTLTAERDNERMARTTAEAVGMDRAVANERLIAGIPAPFDAGPMMEAIREMAQKNGAKVEIPAFDASFKRDREGRIASPVRLTPVPKGP